VFRTDVGVVQLQRLAQGEFQGLLRARRERDMAAALLRAGLDHRGDIDLRLLLVVAELVQHVRRHAVRRVQQRQQDVLGADVAVFELSRLLLGRDDHLAGFHRELVEWHGSMVATMSIHCH